MGLLNWLFGRKQEQQPESALRNQWSAPQTATVVQYRASLREIVLDFETTGLTDDDRVIEFGAIEMIDGVVDGDRHGTAIGSLIDPEGRKSHPVARKKHGISSKELIGKPKFSEIADALLAFIGDSNIVAHHAKFEMRMLNNELRRCGREPLPEHRFICTLEMSRRKYADEQGHTLDDLLVRHGLDPNAIVRHRAVQDALVLAMIYPRLKAA